MLDRLMSLLSPKTEEEHAPGDPDRVRIATCVLLLEVAGADNEFSASECERILQAMQSRFDLSQEDAEELLRVAEERRTESFDLWKFTNQINEACPNDEKTQIIEEVWRV
ncbi:MAG: TerB family tellurite resistance protein, partial [bacterium]|nr:TerB family tellurite resistance protein [bacterium]